MLFYYTLDKDANYFVNIDSVVEKKLDAAVAHVSQFEPSIHRYRADWDPADLAKTRQGMKQRIPKKDGHYVETFRVATGFNQQ